MEELRREMEVVAGLTKKCIEENSTAAQDQEEYAARYNGYVDRYEKAKERCDALGGCWGFDLNLRDSNPRALGKAPGALCNPRRPAPQRRSNPFTRTKEQAAPHGAACSFI